MMKWGLRRQTVFNFIILCPIFLVFSFLSSRWYDARKHDFSQYWQAGRMIVAGQDIYDKDVWIAENQREGTALFTNPPFQYPLPLAILFVPLAMLPIDTAYILWMFLAEIMVLASITLLLDFYPVRSGYFELLTITGIFFFRPMFSVIQSGQIVTPLLLLLVLAIRCFHAHKWFWGGLALSVLSLKPSLGLPILFLSGLWLLSRRQWRGLWGMIAGGLLLWLVGVPVNYGWPGDYVNISQNIFAKYYGMHPTLWGMVDKIFKIDSLSMTVGFLCVAVVLAVEAYVFWRNKSNVDAWPAFASILPVALLVAPYSWNYDQILLVIPIVFLLIHIFAGYGIVRSALFIFGIVALAFAMVAVAYLVGHDVWSALNSLVVWIFSLYFVVKNSQLPNEWKSPRENQ